MNVDTTPSIPSDEPSPAVFAEAAAWVACLHGPNRTLRVEEGLRRWLKADPSHAAAFEAMTAAWEVTGNIPLTAFPRVSSWQRVGYRQGFIRSALVVASIAVLAIGISFYVQKVNGVATEIGEQRLLTLDDGTRVFLNTATRVVVRYDETTRKVELKGGEALFDVAKRPDWPFIVEAADRQVRAVGTSFVVREDSNRLSVTLVEGKVTVSPIDGTPTRETGTTELASSRESMPSASQATSVDPTTRKEGSSLPPPSSAQTQGSAPQRDTVDLVPGQRLTFGADRRPTLDQPPIDKLTAWRRGLVDFENAPLGQAVEEMNRYSVVKLAVAEPQAAAIPVTGVFRAGDASSFAAAVARAYGLQVTESDNEIRLTSHP